MKTTFRQLLLLMLAATLFYACGGDDDDDVVSGNNNPPTNNNNNTTTVTYATIATIMNGNCTSCHGSTPSNGAPNSLTTYDQVRNAVESRNLIGRVQNGTMPPNGSLSSTQINNIIAWQSQGFPQ